MALFGVDTYQIPASGLAKTIMMEADFGKSISLPLDDVQYLHMYREPKEAIVDIPCKY